MFYKKKVFLEISQNSQENTCFRDSFLIKLQAKAKACNFIKKECLAQVFSYEFSEFSKNTFFIEDVRWLLLIRHCVLICKVIAMWLEALLERGYLHEVFL